MHQVAVLVEEVEVELGVVGAKALMEHQEHLGHWLQGEVAVCLSLVA